MQAIRYCEYGPPDVLKLEEVEKPVPNDNEVLVRIRAASLNAADGHMMRGGFLPRLMFGLRKPRNTRFGLDFAGVTEAVGRKVTDFKPGDEVFGAKQGAVAEYICVPDRVIVSKPANVTFAEAAAVPVAGVTALQGLRDKGKIRAGDKVLINGASGGVGTFAVQIAKAFDTEVTAVCSTRNLETARALGADRVIDYTKEDFTRSEQGYDLLFDNVGNHSFSERCRVLKPEGICVLAGMGSAGAHPGQWSRLLGNLTAPFKSRFTKQKFEMYMARITNADLSVLRDLMAEGKLKPLVEKTYRVTETADALRYLEAGHARGKIVIMISETPSEVP
jgi:NADPH:quinone reductase-like Zn-dependent oxidoreductase